MNNAPVIPYSDLEWFWLRVPNDGDPPPPPVKPDFHWHAIVLLVSILRRYQRAHGLHWYLGVESSMTMPRHRVPREVNPGPDLFMAEADDHERRSWNVEDEGSLPLFVLEVVTEDSWTQDTEHKPMLYDRMGVREYLIFAPERKEAGPQLFGHRRNTAGEWVAWEAEETGELRSDEFGGLRFFVDRSRLRVRDVEGHILLSDEEAAEYEAARATRETVRAEQEATRAEHEAARADAAEAELRLLKARYGLSAE